MTNKTSYYKVNSLNGETFKLKRVIDILQVDYPTAKATTGFTCDATTAFPDQGAYNN